MIRWDRRGYGRSDSPQAPFSNGDDLLAVEFALEHPEMVSSLVLVGPIVSGFGFSEHLRTRGNRGMPPFDAPLDQRIEYWGSKDPWIIAPENQDAKDKAKSLLIANPQNLQGSARYARHPDEPAMARLPEIDVPTLIVVGESDIADVHAHIGVIQAGIAGSERVVLAHSGHLCHFEAPGAFNQVVLDFLATVE